MGKQKKSKVVAFDGDDCPRCGQPTLVYEHIEITEKHRRQPFYYRRWFVCRNNDCQTTLIMPEKFKVSGAAQSAPQSRPKPHWRGKRRPPPRESISEIREALGLPSGTAPLALSKPPWED